MPYMIGGLTTVLMISCTIHAIRTDRTQPWLYILIFLPGVGSLLYLILELIPGVITARQSNAMRRGVGRIVSPNRDLNTARRDVELVGSADAKLRLSEEYYFRGQYGEAADLLRSALTGVHSEDPALLYALARALIAKEDGAGAQAALDALQESNPTYDSSDAHLLYARSLEMQGKDDEALDEYEKLVRYSSGEEARCRFGLLLKRMGKTDRAARIFAEIIKLTDGAPGHYRRAQREWREIAKRELAG
jgi:hypothetical protein